VTEMKTITITYKSSAWSAKAKPPITLDDEIILFSNEAGRPCLIMFEVEEAFGIMGIIIGPKSGFTLVFRGVATEFRLMDPPRDADTHNPTIPPGSLFRKKR
jgi:hypothetical protein